MLDYADGNQDSGCSQDRAGDSYDRACGEENHRTARERRSIAGNGWAARGRAGRRLFRISYAMRLDTQARDRDKVFEEFGARIFVDPKSLLYLNGTTLEYEETLMRQGFVFQNPNAARGCGCGSSFTA